MSNELKAFQELSETLTGFGSADLSSTGAGQEYLNTLIKAAGRAHVGELLDLAAQAAASVDPVKFVNDAIWEDPRFGPLARSIVLMWYLGKWYELPKPWYAAHDNGETAALRQHVVSVVAYKEGLVWKAIGAHPPGAKPPGFGSWSKPPAIRRSDD